MAIPGDSEREKCKRLTFVNFTARLTVIAFEDWKMPMRMLRTLYPDVSGHVILQRLRGGGTLNSIHAAMVRLARVIYQ